MKYGIGTIKLVKNLAQRNYRVFTTSTDDMDVSESLGILNHYLTKRRVFSISLYNDRAPTEEKLRHIGVIHIKEL